jgi:hypothetical protein
MKPTNARIELLQRKEQQIHAQIAVERAKSQRRAAREDAIAEKNAGEAVIREAKKDPGGFGLTLKRILDTSITEKRARDLLRRKGLL